MAENDEDRGSWKARCDRYFTSLTDSDVPDHKDIKGDNSKLKDTKHDKHETWRSLSELKKQNRGAKGYTRRVMSTLDIHGARICGSSDNVTELSVWLTIIIGCVAVLGYIVYLQVNDYNSQNRTFDTVKIETAFKSTEIPKVSFCNRNILKSSSLSGTRFAYLVQLDKEMGNTESTGHLTGTENTRHHDAINDAIESNKKLKTMFAETEGAVKDAVIAELHDDIIAKIFADNVNTSVVDYLAANGPHDKLLEFLEPTLMEIQVQGHQMKDMLVVCVLDGRECRESELVQVSHEDLGNCFTVKPSKMSRTESLEVILDVASEEYLNVASPSVGVNIIIHHEDLTLTPSPEAGRSKYLASPNIHLDIDILQETLLTRKEDSCNPVENYTKEECLSACVTDVIGKTCGCQPLTRRRNDSFPVCRNSVFSQYICMRAVKEMYTIGRLPCHCPEKCSVTTYSIKTSFLNWPSDQHMKYVRSQMKHIGHYMDQAYIRNNLVKVSVNLQPNVFHEITEQEHRKLLDILAMVGGLSALIIGVSVLTLVELLWVAVKMTWNFVLRHKRRNNLKNVHRLSDSEITSITWAMHRQKRREEEIRKEREAKNYKKNNKNETNLFVGNVQRHIARRNNYFAPVPEGHEQMFAKVKESTPEKRNRDMVGDLGQGRVYDNNAYRQGRRSFDLPHYAEHTNPRLMRISRKTPEVSDSSRGNMMHLEGIYRPTSHQVYYEHVSYPQIGRLVTPADAIQLYGGQSPFYTSKQISEPMYI